MDSLISVEEAEEKIKRAAFVAAPHKVPLQEAHHLILAEDIIADRPLPPFDRSMMDGYAIRVADYRGGTRSFTVLQTIYAGDPIPVFSDALPEHACLEIMTGAAVPAPFDCVVPIEKTRRYERTMTLSEDAEIKEKQYVHVEGSDFPQGSALLKEGSPLASPQIAIAASCGYADVMVYPPPRVAIVSTGDELVAIDETPLPTQIRRSNDLALVTALQAMNIRATCYHLADDSAQTQGLLTDILQGYDFIFLSGGVSKGKKDFIAPALQQAGVEKVFHGVAQRPGKPFWFGKTSNRQMVFALPGNPLSTLICFHRYAVPALLSFMQKPHFREQWIPLAQEISFLPPLTYFLPVQLSHPEKSALPCPAQNSGDYASVAYTNGFVELPRHQSKFPAGYRCRYFPWL